MSPRQKSYQAQLEALQKAPFNLELLKRHEYTREAGWNIDDYEADLPPEAPGEPLPEGSFRLAQQILQEYKFPPSGLIQGYFQAEDPLEKRVMLLRAQFLGLRFWFGVRITGVSDGLNPTPAGPERIWGYSYATLEGHFERGQIEFLVVKNLSSGAVYFRIHAFSQAGFIANPFYRLGFRIFGRWLQRRFAHQSMHRLQQMVKQLQALQAVRKAQRVA